MPVPLLDLTRQYEALRDDIEAAALRVLRSGRYILGPEVEGFEREVASYVRAKHCVGLSSGTDALLAALMALDVGPGDEVAMPVYSFFATAGVVARLHARPVFVDVEPTWCNLDPAALERELQRRPRLKAVIVVHLFGAPADMDAIVPLCQRHGVAIVEDAAQAIGTRRGGKDAGTFGIAGCFSTFPSKNLGGPGDGGFLTTDDDAFAWKVQRLRHHGQTEAYRHTLIGGNFRLDELQAAVLRVKLRRLEEFTAARRQNAARYRELFAARGLNDVLQPPTDVADRHTYHQYVVRLPEGRRDAVQQRLTAAGIGCAVYYPLPFHLQPCFADLGYAAGEFPVAEEASRTSLALPIFPELRADEAEQVADALAAALRG